MIGAFKIKDSLLHDVELKNVHFFFVCLSNLSTCLKLELFKNFSSFVYVTVTFNLALYMVFL